MYPAKGELSQNAEFLMNEIICISLILSCIISYVATNFVLKFAHKKRLYDSFDERKIHKGNIPRLGGVAFSLATILTIILVGIYVRYWGSFKFALYFATHSELIMFAVIALLLVTMTGLLDDLIGFRYRTKFIAQISAGVLVCYSGFWINNFHGLFGLYHLNIYQGWILTIFTVVLITNAINFIDGIDGLAGTLSLFFFVFYFIVAYTYTQLAILIITIPVIGALLPFLYFNLFGKAEKKKKIFMGDTGSLFVGFLVSVICIDITNDSANILGATPIAVAYCPLIVPCFDLARVVISRLYENRNPFKADKTHLHHLILSIVKSQKVTLLLIMTLALFITSASILLSYDFNVNLVFMFDVMIWIMVMMVIYRKLKKNN